MVIKTDGNITLTCKLKKKVKFRLILPFISIIIIWADRKLVCISKGYKL